MREARSRPARRGLASIRGGRDNGAVRGVCSRPPAAEDIAFDLGYLSIREVPTTALAPEMTGDFAHEPRSFSARIILRIAAELAFELGGEFSGRHSANSI